MKSARTAGKSEAHKYWLRFQLIKHSMFNGGRAFTRYDDFCKR